MPLAIALFSFTAPITLTALLSLPTCTPAHRHRRQTGELELAGLKAILFIEKYRGGGEWPATGGEGSVRVAVYLVFLNIPKHRQHAMYHGKNKLPK